MKDTLQRLYNIEYETRVLEIANATREEDWKKLAYSLLDTSRNIINRIPENIDNTNSHNIHGVNFWLFCLNQEEPIPMKYLIGDSYTAEDKSIPIDYEEQVSVLKDKGFIILSKEDEKRQFIIVSSLGLTHEKYLKFLYSLVLERETDKDGFNSLINASRNKEGDSYDFLNNSILNSKEAKNKDSKWTLV